MMAGSGAEQVFGGLAAGCLGGDLSFQPGDLGLHQRDARLQFVDGKQ